MPKTGYADLYFGSKHPGNKNRPLLSVIGLRISTEIINQSIKLGHQAFANALLKGYSISDSLREEFGFDLERQFPTDKCAFFEANWVYGARGLGTGELMFFRISPSYVHSRSNNVSAIVDSSSSGIDGVVSVHMPEELMKYFYAVLLGR